MADPLSAVASIISITDFGVKGVNSLRHLYRSYKDAPKQMEQLRNEAPAHWAFMMQLGQVFDAAAEMGDDDFSRMIFELGEQGNTFLNEIDKLLANDEQLDATTRQKRTRRDFIGAKLRHFAKRCELRSKHRLALAQKKNFENLRGSMNSILLAQSTRQTMSKQRLAILDERTTRSEVSRSSRLSLVETSSKRLYNTPRCSSSCVCNCHNHIKRLSAHVLPNSMQGIWRAMMMASSRKSHLNSYCHDCRSVPRAQVARLVNWRVPNWFGPLVVQFSVRYSLRRGLSCRLKATQRVVSLVGDIFWSIQRNDIEQIRSLLKTSPTVVNDQWDLGGHSPLHAAVHLQNPDIVALLLDHGADTAIEDDRGIDAALAFAIHAFKGYFPRTDHYELHSKLSIAEGLEDATEYLGYGTVHKIVLNLLETDLREYLEDLEENERLEQIHHADGFGRTPLHLAASQDDAEAVEILLSFGAELEIRDTAGFTPLAALARCVKGAKSFKLLAEKGANIHAKNTHGDSIIHVAAYTGSLELIEQLYWLGVDIDTLDSRGGTPLILAAIYNQPNIVERLIEWGSAMDAVDEDNDTALIYAIEVNAHEVINLLLSKNANHRHANGYGRTIWHCAAMAADARTMKILQSLKPRREDLTWRDKFNRTPFDILCRHFRGRQEVWDMFERLSKEADTSREVTEEA